MTSESAKYERVVIDNLKKLSNNDYSGDLLSTDDCLKLLTALRMRSASHLPRTLASCEKMSQSITCYFAKNLQDACERIGKRNSPHVLTVSHKGDSKSKEDIKDFNWNGLLFEIINKIPFFMKCLLAVILPANPEEKEIRDARYRLSVAFAILLQGRCREASGVQRLITNILKESSAQPKVGLCVYNIFVFHFQ